MKNKLFKIVFLCLLFINVVHASEVDLNSSNYILYNMNDGTIIDSKNENDRVSVASLTKIMSVIVAIENIEDYNQKVVINSEMLKGIARDVVVVGFKDNEVKFEFPKPGALVDSTI